MKCCLLPSGDLSVFIVAEWCVFDTLWGYKGGAMFAATKGFSLFISCCLSRNAEVSDLRCMYIFTLYIVHHTAMYISILRTNLTISD